MVQGRPKEDVGRAMCSNNAPGCSQEYFFAEEWRHPKKPQDEARKFREDSRRAQGEPGEGPWEGHVLQTLCFKLFLRHPKKPQDEARNFDEGPRAAQGGSKEGPRKAPMRAMCSRPFVLS